MGRLDVLVVVLAMFLFLLEYSSFGKIVINSKLIQRPSQKLFFYYFLCWFFFKFKFKEIFLFSFPKLRAFKLLWIKNRAALPLTVLYLLAWPLALMDYLSLLVAIGCLGNCSRALGRRSQPVSQDKNCERTLLSIDSCVGKILAQGPKGNRI